MTTTDPTELDEAALAEWLVEVVDPSATACTVARLGGGHSSGAWRVDLHRAGGPRRLVLKAPTLPSVVHRRDAVREAATLDALGRAGAPVPRVVAVESTGAVIGRPVFVMEHIESRALADSGMGGFHEDAWLGALGPAAQAEVWGSFYDTLGALHRADPTGVAAVDGTPCGSEAYLRYWHDALLDAVPAETVPRQLAALDWLAAHLPGDADRDPAVCMGDARLANGLVVGDRVGALVDLEVAYVGNPAADVGYSTFMEAAQRANAAAPLPGVGGAEAAWDRWEAATGRRVEDRAYWSAFGAAVLSITATRALVQWGLAGPDVESTNLIVDRWEAALAEAGR